MLVFWRSPCREEETMLSVNKVILMGILADRPIVREIEGGGMMVGLSVVTSRGWHDNSHNQTDDREWHRVVITHPDLAGYAETHLEKDDQVYLEGELQTTFWRDATYNRQSLTRVLLWQECDRLQRVVDGEGHDAAAAPHLRMAARQAHLLHKPGDEAA
jgi:single stranded DNA-binding protein